MSVRKIKSENLNLLLGFLLFSGLLTSLFMTSAGLHSTTRFSHLYTALLSISAIGLILMSLLVIKKLYIAIRQLRENKAGARFSGRLLFMFVGIAIMPTVLVFSFAILFLNNYMNQWFNLDINQAMDNALKLSRASLAEQSRQATEKSEHLVTVMPHIADEIAVLKLNELRLESGALELTIIDNKGVIIAFNSAERDKFLPEKQTVVVNFEKKKTHVNLETTKDNSLRIRVVNKYIVNSGEKINQLRYLHALYPVSNEVARFSKEVTQATSNYKQMLYLRTPLNLSVFFVLTLVLLLGILGTIWTALIFSRYLAAPVRDMVKGTQAVAAGNYNEVPVTHLDELGFLIESFNAMTAKLKQSHQEAKHSRHILERQRAYLEVVLGRLSSGVLSLDCDNHLRTFNTAASDILGLELDKHMGRNFLRVCVETSALQPLGELLESHLLSNDGEWQEQIILFTGHGRHILLCSGTNLPDTTTTSKREHHVPKQLGYVIVFDDITTLVKAQRNAAWGEVARRLAHEIKNPLTPIRLSAERLRYKYLDTFPEKEARTLDRMTNTIIQQVEAMRKMLDNFADYARSPQILLLPLDLNQLIKEVTTLYLSSAVSLTQHLADDLPLIQADSGQLRQVLHNLLKNSIEASDEYAEINISTAYQQEATRKFVECRIKDNGTGVSQDRLEEIFEPYITHKPKGTGLGLAIVKKIIEEHGGIIWLENNPEGGACIIIRFPQ